MNNLQNMLLELIKIALNPEDKSSIVLHESEWPELYKLISEQGMGSILFPIISILPETSKPNRILYDQWKNQILFAAVSQLSRIQRLKRIVDNLNSVNLPFIVLKGPAIARFYDRPEYRIMGDLDILVEDKDMVLAQQTIELMGYTLLKDEDDHPFHLVYGKQGDLPIELHYSLYVPGILGHMKMNDWYRHIWRNRKLISFNGIEFYVMAEEDELINQILHFARHMLGQSAKMKNIYDTALIIRHCDKQLDWKYIMKEMEHIQILRFGTLIFSIFNKFFNINTDRLLNQTGMSPEVFLDKFLNYFSVEIGTEFNTWYALITHVPFFCRSLLTLPVVYIIDFMAQLIKNKRTIKDSLLVTSYNMKLFASKVQTITIIGLTG